MIKSLTKREKVLLVVLAVVIVFLGWYKLVYEPLNEDISSYQAMIMEEQGEYDACLPKLMQLSKMEQELEVLRNDGEAKKIPLYNNKKELLASLDDVLEDTTDLILEFGNPDADDYIVLRNIGLNFRCNSYKDARSIIDNLAEDTFTNQISDLYVRNSGPSNEIVAAATGHEIKEGETEVQLVITFFEVSGT